MASDTPNKIDLAGVIMDNTGKRGYLLSTIFVSLFITTDAINLIATRILPVNSNFMSAFYALTGTGIVLSFFLMGGAHRLKMRIQHFVGIVIVTLYYVITYLVIGGSSLSLSFFGVFVFLPLFIPVLVDIEVKHLLRLIFIIPSFGILRASSILLLTSRRVMTMGDCYALLIPIIAALTYMMTFYKEDKQKTKLLLLPCLIVNFIYYMRIVMYGSRGPILSVFLCFVFLLLFKGKDNVAENKQIWKMIVYTVLIALFMLYFWEILRFVYVFASRIGLNIRAIDKVYMLRQTSTIWNGRDGIVAITLEGIIDRPILGHGISTFQKNTGIIYPHNFILQILYDGGIVLFIPLIIPFISGIIKVIRFGSTDDMALFSLLFFSSVPGALFSGDCWKNGCLWLLIGMLIASKIPTSVRTRDCYNVIERNGEKNVKHQEKSVLPN